MGQTLVREDADNQVLEVTGILKSIPANSHLQLDLLTSFETYFSGNGYPATFQSNSFWFPKAKMRSAPEWKASYRSSF